MKKSAFLMRKRHKRAWLPLTPPVIEDDRQGMPFREIRPALQGRMRIKNQLKREKTDLRLKCKAAVE
ncbi:MAG: hypothetical protein IKI84_02865 [Clostridia bacterium]|nr:hypothetical protein [Clostridia bacterium]